MARRQWGEHSAVPSGEQAGIRGRMTCSQEPEEGWGSRAFVSSLGSAHAEQNPHAQLFPTLLCGVCESGIC